MRYLQVALLHKHTALVSSSTKPTTINMEDLKTMSTPIINNGLSRSRLSVKSKNGTAAPDGTLKKNPAKVCNLYGMTFPPKPRLPDSGYNLNKIGDEESDSENSTLYHEPYKLLRNGKQEYNCLLKKEGLTSSQSGEYTGKLIRQRYSASLIISVWEVGKRQMKSAEGTGIVFLRPFHI